MPTDFSNPIEVRGNARQRWLAALVCTTALMSASQALAQTTAPSSQSTGASSQNTAASGNRVQEIVVTAEFRKENLQNTPIAITSFNSRMLEARGQTNITQVAAQAPNVSLRPAGSSLGNTLVAYIRGVGQGDFNYALEPGVGIYIDDIYFATATGAEFNLLDLDRVEILRGPQGTLAGKNSIGGAIKLYSKQPDGNGGGYVEGSYGSDNLIQGKAAADFTIVPDKLFARVSLVSRHQDGYVTMLDYKCAHPGPIDTGVPGLGTIPNNLPTLSRSQLRARQGRRRQLHRGPRRAALQPGQSPGRQSVRRFRWRQFRSSARSAEDRALPKQDPSHQRRSFRAMVHYRAEVYDIRQLHGFRYRLRSIQ